MNRRLLLAALGSLLLCNSPVWAVNSYPMVMGIKPVAVQAGTTAELAVQARYSMSGSYQVLVSGTGVTGEIVDSHSTPAVTPKKKRATPPKVRRAPSLELLNVRFHADKNALPGIRDIRLAGPYGASTVGQLLVVEDPVISEKKDNDSPEKAQRITLPAAVCGTIESIEDRDYFKFHVEAGQSLVFRVRGMLLEDRIHDLQNHLDPIITLRGPTGATLAVARQRHFGRPPLVPAVRSGRRLHARNSRRAVQGRSRLGLLRRDQRSALRPHGLSAGRPPGKARLARADRMAAPESREDRLGRAGQPGAPAFTTLNCRSKTV